MMNLTYWTAVCKGWDLDKLLVDCAKSYERMAVNAAGLLPSLRD